MGAPIGNDNASKSRVVHDELRKLAVQDDYRRLRKGLERVMDAFENGEPWAAQFVRDSLDGRPTQTQQLNIGGSLQDALARIVLLPIPEKVIEHEE